MKKIIVSVIMFSIISMSLLAQVNTNMPPIPASSTSFFGTVQNWLTTANPDNAWTNSKAEISIGLANYQDRQVTLANQVRVSYDLSQVISAEAGFADSGISGVIVNGFGGFAANVKLVDTKISFYADGVYSRHEIKNKLNAEVGIRATKKMTKFTFVGIGMGVLIPDNSRVFSAFTGFVF